ncbi:hypothetical protein ACFPM3_04020 [Streptomyces coeruleoprunus]|uniref:Uncharacterized protein n=1 Tax=Streptomyces coeruleoprunus TaxID=285563 RepID=A0ABV9X7C6_9ACTN
MLLINVAVWLLITPMRFAFRDEQAFRNAVPCHPEVTGPDDCLRTVPAIIDGTERTEGFTRLTLTQQDGKVTRVRIPRLATARRGRGPYRGDALAGADPVRRLRVRAPVHDR